MGQPFGGGVGGSAEGRGIFTGTPIILQELECKPEIAVSYRVHGMSSQESCRSFRNYLA